MAKQERSKTNQQRQRSGGRSEGSPSAGKRQGTSDRSQAGAGRGERMPASQSTRGTPPDEGSSAAQIGQGGQGRGSDRSSADRGMTQDPDRSDALSSRR